MARCSNCGEEHLASEKGGDHWSRNRNGKNRCTYRTRKDRNGLIW